MDYQAPALYVSDNKVVEQVSHFNCVECDLTYADDNDMAIKAKYPQYFESKAIRKKVCK